MLSKAEVKQIAHLARLELTDEQVALYQEQLSAILAYAARLEELDLDGVEPTTHAVQLHNVWRADDVEQTLPLQAVAQNTRHWQNDQFVVPAVFDETS